MSVLIYLEPSNRKYLFQMLDPHIRRSTQYSIPNTRYPGGLFYFVIIIIESQQTDQRPKAYKSFVFESGSEHEITHRGLSEIQIPSASTNHVAMIP